jgi:uncharacterized membrane protein
MQSGQQTTRAVSESGRSFLLYAFAIGLGLILATIGMLTSSLQLIIIPISAYVAGTILNLIAQNGVCSKSNMSQAFSLGLISMAISTVTYFLVANIGLFARPITALFPNMDPFTQKRFIIGFYLFWAGVYSQIFSSGFVQACPS